MLSLPWIAVVSLLALGGAAADEPDEPMQWTWVEGQLTQVDSDRHTVVIHNGRRELAFTLDPRAEIVDRSHAVSAGALHGDVGRAVFVRYCVTPTGRVADFVEIVSGGPSVASPMADEEASGAAGPRLPLYRQ